MDKEANFKKFLAKAKKVHGGKYDYSKVDYVNSREKICIICPEHGEFWQSPSAHIRGNECPKCANFKRGGEKRWDSDKFISAAKSIHGDKYDYSKVKYINASTIVSIICPKHGEFKQKPTNHLQGHECPKCRGRNLRQDEIITLFKEKHGEEYNYSKVSFTKMHEKVCIICPKHGEFWQTPSKHIKGQGCPECSKIKMTTESFIERAKIIHSDKYDYGNTVYNGEDEKVLIKCPIHGEFYQRVNNHLQGCGCPICANNTSKTEEEVYKYCCEIAGRENVIHRDRNLLEGKEIDILIPSAKICIEFDGLYWHCEEKKEKKYHLEKTEECESKGYQLIHIFEDEWSNKNDICKSRLRNILGKTKNKIYARKCSIRRLEKNEAKTFFNDNHIQGAIAATVTYGLFYEEELVSAMSFCGLRKNLGNNKKNGEYELLRFCNKIDYSVVGGASKLFNTFIKEYNPLSVISYADRRWSKGNLYTSLGFKWDRFSQPSYFYIVNGVRKNRFGYRKDILVKKYGCPQEISEREFCKQQKWYRIYDCGTIKFVWKK